MLKSIRHSKILFGLLRSAFLSLLFVGVSCSRIPISLPKPETVEPEALTPTVMLTPTSYPMPEGPYPPVVVAFTPRQGEEVPPETAITLHFDQPMDRESVAAAFHVTPEPVGPDFVSVSYTHLTLPTN